MNFCTWILHPKIQGWKSFNDYTLQREGEPRDQLWCLFRRTSTFSTEKPVYFLKNQYIFSTEKIVPFLQKNQYIFYRRASTFFAQEPVHFLQKNQYIFCRRTSTFSTKPTNIFSPYLFHRTQWPTTAVLLIHGFFFVHNIS